MHAAAGWHSQLGSEGCRGATPDSSLVTARLVMLVSLFGV
jgi:hypothetical protein